MEGLLTEDLLTLGCLIFACVAIVGFIYLINEGH